MIKKHPIHFESTQGLKALANTISCIRFPFFEGGTNTNKSVYTHEFKAKCENVGRNSN